MLPSGPGGVRRIPLRGAQPSTPSRTAHSTRPALEREFNPAIADCGLQGTATSPSSTANRCRSPIRVHLLRWRPRLQAQRTGVRLACSLRAPPRSWTLLANRRAHRYRTTKNGGGGGIRTHGTVARTRHFQCRTFGHSATPPRLLRHTRLQVRSNWRRGEDLNPRGTCAPIRFRVGRLQPGSATPPRLLSRSLRHYPECPSVAAGRGRVHPYGEPRPR